MIRNLWRRLQGPMVQDVPADIAVCEFDCPSVACRRGAWERCEHRLRDSTPRREPHLPWPATAAVEPGRGGERA
jgi:hypothetical protein